jgi:hypothetical protein
MSNSFIILTALNEVEALSTTQISEKIAINSRSQLFKVSGALKDSLENRLRMLAMLMELISLIAKKIENPFK